MKARSGEPEYTAAATWESRRRGRGDRLLRVLARLTARAERPVDAVTPSRLNPLHHTGPIAVFLFAVAFATGVYLTMFYRFGFEASYASVESLEASLVGRIVRAAHRYSSIALVVASLLHGWRTFVTGRFQKPRRTAWVTGVVMVAVVWLIGVTGYWLIWDERAQVLNEALRKVIGSFSSGLDFMLDNVLTAAAGSGWPFILLLFLLHFGLSLAVAILIWFHERHLARPTWLPDPRWTAIVGVSLLAAAVMFPLGMLPELDPRRLVGAVNADPFFLFLLPLTLTVGPGALWGGALVVLAVAVGLPWALRTRRPPPVEVIEDRCIGCTWCAADCPYDAIKMIDTPEGEHLHLALVDAARCVSCGICLGSCPTQALALEGIDPRTMWDELEPRDGDLRITCQRHADLGGLGDDTLVVPCVGMVAPRLLEAAADHGLTVEVLGCPVDDCSFREGSLHVAERSEHRRPPHIRGAYRDAPVSFVTAPVGSAPLAEPPVLDVPPVRTLSPRRIVAFGTAFALVVAGSIWVTRAEYDVGESAQSAITIAMDHRSGIPLVGDDPSDATPTGESPQLRVVVDGTVEFDRTVETITADGPDTALLYERFIVEPGTHQVSVTLVDAPGEPRRVLFDDLVALAAGEALVLEYRDQEVVAAADAGKRLFENSVRGVRAGCVICHSTEPGVVLVGPSLSGIAERAAKTVPGLGAEEYLRQSIIDPDAYVVPGFPAGQMLPDLAETLTPEQIEQLVAYLLTLGTT